MSSRPDADLALARDAHRRVVHALRGLDDATAQRPSRLPEWTVAHVLTHIARNADGLRNIAEGVARGERWPMYPGGRDQRNGDIEAGVGRGADALVADVRDACAALEAAWDALDDAAWANGEGDFFGTPRPVGVTPFVRVRETLVHAVDAGLDTFGVDDWPLEYASRDLAQLPAVELPVGAPALDARHLLAWRLGREVVPGLPDAPAWQ